MAVTRPPLTLAMPISLENQLTVRPDRLSTLSVLAPPTPSERDRSERLASGKGTLRVIYCGVQSSSQTVICVVPPPLTLTVPSRLTVATEALLE